MKVFFERFVRHHISSMQCLGKRKRLVCVGVGVGYKSHMSKLFFYGVFFFCFLFYIIGGLVGRLECMDIGKPVFADVADFNLSLAIF